MYVPQKRKWPTILWVFLLVMPNTIIGMYQWKDQCWHPFDICPQHKEMDLLWKATLDLFYLFAVGGLLQCIG